MAQLWGVWCIVDGGHIGHREDWLHCGIERKIWVGTLEEAKAEATRLNVGGRSSHTTTIFAYHAKKIPPYEE